MIKLDGGLSNEIWTMIVEESHKISLAGLALMSQLSRRMNAITRPIMYREIILEGAQDHWRLEPLASYSLTHVRQYTKRLSLDPEAFQNVASWDDAVKLLLECMALTNLSWKCNVWPPGKATPRIFFEAISRLQPGTRFHASLTAIPGFSDDLLLPYFPWERVSSLNATLRALQDPGYLRRYGEVLKQGKHLDSLSLNIANAENSPDVENFAFFLDISGQLPAVRELALDHYYWPPARNSIQHFWDFSNLQQLSLAYVPLVHFLANSATSVEAFSGLRSLSISHGHWSSKFAQLSDSYKDEYNFYNQQLGEFWKVVTQLQKLTIQGRWAEICPLSAFSSFGIHLSELKLTTILDDNDFRIANLDGLLTPKNLIELNSVCRSLSRFECTVKHDLDTGYPQNTIEALVKFPSLKSITLYTSCHLEQESSVNNMYPSSSQSSQAAQKMMNFLVENKVGVPFQNIKITTGTERSTHEEYRNYEYGVSRS